MSRNDGPPHPFDADTTHQVRRAVGGDAASLGWLFVHFLPLLRAQAAWRLGVDGRSPEADDLVAEAWLVALPRLRTLVPRDGRYTPVFLAFLAETAKRLANDRLRKRARRRTTDAEHEALDRRQGVHEARSVHDVLRLVEREETLRRIQDGVDALDPDERVVVVLRGVEGRSNQEVAAEIGDAPGTVSKRYRRALVKLRAALGGSVFDELEDGPDEPA